MSINSQTNITHNFIQQQNEEREFEPKKNYVEDKFWTRVHSIICTTKFKGIFFLFLFSITVPILIFYFIIDQDSIAEPDTHTCLVNTTFRVPCGKVNISESECLDIHCCYDENYMSCFHFLPSRYSYSIDKNKDYHPSYKSTPFGNENAQNIALSVKSLDDNKVQINLHMNSKAPNDDYVSTSSFKITKIEDPLIIQITRNDDVLLTTAKGPLIVSDHYWEWTIHLTDQELYGLGETLIKLNENSTLTKVIYPNKRNHNTPPVFWAYKNGNFHGIVIRHDGPMEVTVLPSNLVILRGLVPKDVEIELAVGSSPSFLRQLQNNVTVTDVDDLLQTHICRGSNEISLAKLLDEYEENSDDKFDTECIHENLFMAMMNNDKVGIDDLKKITETLLGSNIGIYLSIPPHIYGTENELYATAKSENMLYMRNEEEYSGKYLGRSVRYPDYSSGSVEKYMSSVQTVIDTYFKTDDIKGFILSKNWPENEQYELNDPSVFPYMSEELESALAYTIPWDATVDGLTHITKHNNYGNDMVVAFKNHFPDKVVLSASNVYGEFQPSVVDNVVTSWTSMKRILKNILINSAIGNYMVNIPICGSTKGFNPVDQESLCVRWYLIAATLPAFSVSSVKPRRDPEQLNTKFSTQNVERAMKIRNSLIPYYKTILSENRPLVTPMFYYYFEDSETMSLNNQYMLGRDILVAHPFTPKQTTLNVYLPKGIWYEIWDGELYNATVGEWAKLSIIETDWISFVSEGSVIALVEEYIMTLIVALSCDMENSAKGQLILGDSLLDFAANSKSIEINMDNLCNENNIVNTIKLYQCGETYLLEDINTKICTNLTTVITYPTSNP